MIMRWCVNAQAQAGAGEIAVEKLSLLANAVYKKCDAIDGVKDGLLDDPRKCVFDPAADLPKCPADVDAPSCFTKAQAAALKKIYGGVKNSAGVQLFPGQPLGAEVFEVRARRRNEEWLGRHRNGARSGWRAGGRAI